MLSLFLELWPTKTRSASDEKGLLAPLPQTNLQLTNSFMGAIWDNDYALLQDW